MAVAMLVGDRQLGQPVVGPKAVSRLAELGITRVSLLGDQTGIGVVLEGWAFDPARIDEVTRALFPAGGASLRTFHELQHVGVTSRRKERNTT